MCPCVRVSALYLEQVWKYMIILNILLKYVSVCPCVRTISRGRLNILFIIYDINNINEIYYTIMMNKNNKWCIYYNI